MIKHKDKLRASDTVAQKHLILAGPELSASYPLLRSSHLSAPLQVGVSIGGMKCAPGIRPAGCRLYGTEAEYARLRWTDARRADHIVHSLPALSPASPLDLMNEVTRILGKIEEGNPQGTARLPGLPPPERGRPTRTGPLIADIDSGEVSDPDRSAIRERSHGI